MVDFIIIITTGDSVRDQVEVTSIDAAIFPFRLINFHLDPRPWNDLFKIIKYSSDTLFLLIEIHTQTRQKQL